MNTAHFKSTLGVGSRYRLEVRKAENGQLVRASGWSENLIPARGLNMIMGANSHGNPHLQCAVGTGTAVPQMTDTQLQQPFAVSSNHQSITNSWQTSEAPYWQKVTARFRFNAGVFNNTNITEVGTVEFYGSNWLFSRALVVDANGNPAAVTVLSDEFLDVVWEYFVVVGEYSGTFNQLIDGVSVPFTYAIRPIDMTGNNWGNNGLTEYSLLSPSTAENLDYSTVWRNAALAAPHQNVPSGTGIGRFGTSTGAPAYVPGSFVRRFRFNLGLNQGNHANGITGFRLDLTRMRFQCVISPAVAKINTKVYYIEFDVSVANAAIPE